MENNENHADPFLTKAPDSFAKSKDMEGGRASWEEPHLPFRERFRKHWRQMLVHL